MRGRSVGIRRGSTSPFGVSSPALRLWATLLVGVGVGVGASAAAHAAAAATGPTLGASGAAIGLTAPAIGLSGFVRDTTGKILAGSVVLAVPVAGRTPSTTTTLEDGRYLFAQLEPGSYQITAV